MNEVKVKITDEEAEDLLLKDTSYSARVAVLAQFMDMHALDTTDTVVNSAVVEAYNEQMIKAKVVFDKAKDAIINKYIDPETQKKVSHWHINYSAGELIYTVQ